jgi:hypothetical protein
MVIAYVADHPVHRRPRRWSFSVVMMGVLIGAGVSTGAFAAGTLLAPGPLQPVGQPGPDLGEPIAAPADAIPGSPVNKLLGAPLTLDYAGDTTVSLTGRPAAATHARVTVAPTITRGEGGSVSYGTDSGGNNPSVSWTANAARPGGSPTTWYDFPLDSSVTTLYVSSAGSGVLTIQYLEQVPTEFGVNANGQSYGITGDPRGEPDLIAVVATNGRQGYVYRAELEEADGTSAVRQFDSPDDAVAWQEANAGIVQSVPVYESDGTTQIGEFRVGG